MYSIWHIVNDQEIVVVMLVISKISWMFISSRLISFLKNFFIEAYHIQKSAQIITVQFYEVSQSEQYQG